MWRSAGFFLSMIFSCDSVVYDLNNQPKEQQRGLKSPVGTEGMWSAAELGREVDRRTAGWGQTQL